MMNEPNDTDNVLRPKGPLGDEPSDSANDREPESEEIFNESEDLDHTLQEQEDSFVPDVYAHLAFVAGATGITGREVVASLADRGVETLAHIRPDSPYVEEWIEYFRQVGSGVDRTAWEQEAFSQRLADMKPSLVFCLLGSSDRRIHGDGTVKTNPFVDSYMAVDLGLTTMLVRACASAGEDMRFILASAIDAHEKANSEFLRSKAKAEDMLIRSGLPYTIVRIGAIENSDRGGRTAPDKKGIWPFKRRPFVPEPVNPRALAETLVEVALDPECANRVFETDI
jgi:hypothetical protein